MNTSSPQRQAARSSIRPIGVTALALAIALCNNTAHASVSAPGTTLANGEMADIAYGSTGNVFQLTPVLFAPGLGNANLPSEVTKLTSSLTYTFAVDVSTINTSMLVVNYQIRNVSVAESFNNLRLAVIANPDGDQVDYLDQFSEAWASAAAGGPVAREARVFEFDPSLSMLSKSLETGSLLDGAPSSACASASGCDGVFGLQWNVAALNPGEVLTLSLGLSDNGGALSTRFLTALSVNNPLTSLTLSGLITVSPVPEPSTGGLLIGGLAALSALMHRRSSRRR
jgi:hypothetical protein